MRALTNEAPWLLGLALAAMGFSFLSAGCAGVSVPSGHRAVVLSPGGLVRTLDEGFFPISALSQSEVYDVRAQERTEDLVALTADAAPVAARSSLVTYSLVPDELEALDRETGPDYDAVVVRPLLRSVVRRVLAGERWDQLDSDGILAAQKEITNETAMLLRPFHIILESVVIRGVFVDLPLTNASIEKASAWEQRALEARQRVEIARGRSAALRQAANGQSAAHAIVAPTLTPQVLADARRRAWERLLAASSSAVQVQDADHPDLIEVSP